MVYYFRYVTVSPQNMPVPPSNKDPIMELFIRHSGVGFQYSKLCSSSSVNGIRVAKSLHSLLKGISNSKWRWISSSAVRADIRVTLSTPVQRTCSKAVLAACGEMSTAPLCSQEYKWARVLEEMVQLLKPLLAYNKVLFAQGARTDGREFWVQTQISN